MSKPVTIALTQLDENGKCVVTSQPSAADTSMVEDILTDDIEEPRNDCYSVVCDRKSCCLLWLCDVCKPVKVGLNVCCTGRQTRRCGNNEGGVDNDIDDDNCWNGNDHHWVGNYRESGNNGDADGINHEGENDHHGDENNHHRNEIDHNRSENDHHGGGNDHESGNIHHEVGKDYHGGDHGGEHCGGGGNGGDGGGNCGREGGDD